MRAGAAGPAARTHAVAHPARAPLRVCAVAASHAPRRAGARAQFRRMGYQVVDWIADFYSKRLETVQVTPSVKARARALSL